MTQAVTCESVVVVEDAVISKDTTDWTQLLIITVVEGLVAAAVAYRLALFLMEPDMSGGPMPPIMFLQ